jgi:hypothetical protein
MISTGVLCEWKNLWMMEAITLVLPGGEYILYTTIEHFEVETMSIDYILD